jgi:TM2 domain-containing membrane protein YozV
MKKRKTATILALLTGFLGIHRFYLGQPGLGVVYILLTVFSVGILPLILGLVDAAMFATMKDEIFDLKYNRQPYQRGDRRFERESTSRTRRKQRDDRYMDRKRRQDREVLKRRTQTRTSSRTAPSRRAPKVNTSRANPYKQSGVQKFKDYDYDGAISDFHKAIEISPRDVATHFNLACAYSLNEKTSDSIHHLKQAISFGYNNFDNIRNHDALAFLRIQPEYESFEASGFQLNTAQEQQTRSTTEQTPAQQQAPSAPPPQEDNLLEQLKKLAELRQKGLLTTEQYAVEKRRLLE